MNIELQGSAEKLQSDGTNFMLFEIFHRALLQLQSQMKKLKVSKMYDYKATILNLHKAQNSLTAISAIQLFIIKVFPQHQKSLFIKIKISTFVYNVVLNDKKKGKLSSASQFVLFANE